MGTIHDLVRTHGREQARMLVSEQDAPTVDLAARIMAEESDGIGITYSGFCMTFLPHRRLPAEKAWVRSAGNLSLLVEPGRVPKIQKPKSDSDYDWIGVPYGPKARLILLYLQSQAVKTKSSVVNLGASMHNWLERMEISAGGATYKEVRAQADRISRCKLQFDWQGESSVGFDKDGIVKGGIQLRDDGRQGELLPMTVRLSDTFYKLLTAHPVPLWEPALKHLASRSMAMDIYVWLAYRLHILERPLQVSWRALHDQFSNGTQALYHFRPEFRTALKYALAVYEDAHVVEDRQGVLLHPSRPPIPERLIGR